MRWIITDSGLGGLSVCAGLEQELQKRGLGQGIELLYINATPDDRSGYNALPTQAERIKLFDRFLTAIGSRFAPDEIVIACNTLSVIYPQTTFSASAKINVKGIVDAGVKMIDAAMHDHPDHKLIIFATETTTEAGTYPRLIQTASSEVSAQECPELAHSISNDASGEACKELLVGYVDEALERFDQKPARVLAFLGCTHYGYQEKIFQTLLRERGVPSMILNPNHLLVEQLIPDQESEPGRGSEPLSIKFVSRYTIPSIEVQSMEAYFKNTAPLTLAALHNQIVVPELFNSI